MANPSSFLRALTITVFILMVHEGETLKCWTCHSWVAIIGPGCDDPFTGSSTHDTTFIHQECEEHPELRELPPDGTTPENNDTRLNVFCYKLTGKLLGITVVNRGCASSFSDITATSCMDWKTKPTQIFSMIKTETCDVCTGDLCNGATNVVGTIVILLVPFLLVLT